MAEYLKWIILFIVGAVAGIINVNAGGGSSLTLPALIFMGLDGALANGTNRIGILLQTATAVSSFRQQKHHQFRTSLTLALFTLPGAIAGALLSVKVNNEWFQRILGMVMIGIVVSMFIPRPKSEYGSCESKSIIRWPVALAMLGIGFYGGFIQIGVGFLLMASIYHLIKLNLVRVNMHKVFIVFIYTLPALGVFIVTGNVNWSFGLSLAAGMAFGGWCGARIVVKGGEKAVRYILALAILLMAVKLLGIL